MAMWAARSLSALSLPGLTRQFMISWVAGLALPPALFLHHGLEFGPGRRRVIKRMHEHIVPFGVQDEESLIEKRVDRMFWRDVGSRTLARSLSLEWFVHGGRLW
jgi:hypothetical protein